MAAPKRPAARRAPSARQVALAALTRIDEGAFANLVLDGLLTRAELSPRDRRLATELVYGVTRMRRACDWLVDRFVLRPLDPQVRRVLRLGAYQLVFLRIPSHAAVSETVSLAPPRTGSLVNAVLRRVAAAGVPAPDGWPSLGVRLSYPDWIVGRLSSDLGVEAAHAALETMNLAPTVSRRADGYTQDLASQWVAAAVGTLPGERVADLCAGPGGKATALAALGPVLVAAADLRPARAHMIAANARELAASNVGVLVADGTRPALRPGSLDRVLVDAPCSGLGVLRRRPDARWRISEPDVEVLAALQRDLLDGAAGLVRIGGVLAYSVCTMTRAETVAIDEWLSEQHPEFYALAPPAGPWEPAGRGARLLPQTVGSDGMYLPLLCRSG